MYYRLLHDERLANQWFLSDPLADDGQELDAREFTDGVEYRGPAPKRIPIYQQGQEVGFSLSAFDMPVVSKTVGEIVRRVAPGAAEFFPVQIEDAVATYEILNAIQLVDCLDKNRSEFTVWTEAANRPEKLGQYRMISILRIDPERARGHHLFRIAPWPVTLVVSDTLKAAIEDVPNLGVVFEPVV
jgi:hypothetical protein